MIITTTPNVEGKHISKYCGVVAGEVILSSDVFKDMFAGIRYLTGGRAGSNERELQKAHELALQELRPTPPSWGRTPWWVWTWTTPSWARGTAC